ncbi:MAG: NAD(P)/FAD-dependent oxidoreductase [Fidelibacterota bacterium]
MLILLSSRQSEPLNPIKISGAGIAGMTAAINLKKAGKNVVIFEKYPAIGLSRDGDYEGLENWIFEENLHSFFINHGFLFDSIKTHPIFNFTVHFDGVEPFNVHSAIPFFYLVKRGSERDCIDMQLYEQCVSTGVEFEFGNNAPDKITIDASGTKKAAGLIQGMNYKTDLKDQIHLLFGQEYAPKGYAYLIVLDGKATLATAFKKNKDILTNPLQKSIDYFNQKGFMIPKGSAFGSRGSFDIPLMKALKHPYRIGEAGGYQDYLFGFGMRMAMTSGLAIAKHLSGESDEAKRLLKLLNRKCKISFVNRIIYERITDHQKLKIAKSMAVSDRPLNILSRSYQWNFNKMKRWITMKAQYEIRPV